MKIIIQEKKIGNKEMLPRTRLYRRKNGGRNRFHIHSALKSEEGQIRKQYNHIANALKSEEGQCKCRVPRIK